MNPAFPRASEQTAFALAGRGLHATVVRNPRSVHGKGETHGFVPMLAAVARERGARNEAYHAVAEEGVPYRAIAEAIGRQLGLPAKSLALEEAAFHFGGLARWAKNDGPASSVWTRTTLEWEPREAGIVADVERPDCSE